MIVLYFGLLDFECWTFLLLKEYFYIVVLVLLLKKNIVSKIMGTKCSLNVAGKTVRACMQYFAM